MAPTSYVYSTEFGEEPVSRTYQYRKVMKPMLERKRRARINRCLDELKELMVTALQSEGENVSKLEKADILELTVRHLHTLKRQNRLVASPENSYADRFKAGFAHCAQEVSHFLTTPSPVAADPVDPMAGAKLLQHLGSCIRQLEVIGGTEQSKPYQQQLQRIQGGYTPPSSPATNISDCKSMWRPW